MKKVIAIIVVFLLMMSTLGLLVSCIGTEQEAEFGSNLVESIERDESGDVVKVKLNSVCTPDTMVLREKKDKVTLFRVYAKDKNNWKMIYEQDRMGTYRVCVLDKVQTDELKIEIISKSGNTKINDVEVYETTNAEKKMRVTEYLNLYGKNIIDNADNPDFTGYFNVVTDVIMFTGKSITKDGGIEFEEGYDEFKQELDIVRGIKKDLKIIAEINIRLNGDNAYTANVLNDNRDAIVNGISKFLDDNNLDGVDFDWEYPENSKQWRAYSNFLNALHDKISPKGKSISIAIAPWGCGLTNKAISNIDYFNLMAYDIFDKRGEHASFEQTTFYSVWDLMRRSSIKKEQIQLGLSSYGRTTDKSPNAWPDMRWDYNENGASLGKWGNYIKDFAYKDNDGNAKTCDAYLTGYAMNRDKTQYALNAGLGGIMIFRMFCDAPYSYEYSIHKAIEYVLNM